MLRDAPAVIEGFTLQVVEAGHFSRGTLGAAAEAEPTWREEIADLFAMTEVIRRY